MNYIFYGVLRISLDEHLSIQKCVADLNQRYIYVLQKSHNTLNAGDVLQQIMQDMKLLVTLI